VWQGADVKQSALRDMISLVLARKPGSTAKYVADVVGTSRGAVNAVLYKYPQRFAATDQSPPRWSLAVGEPPSP
jgi:hypothetical protein